MVEAANRELLQIALVLDDEQPPAWIARVIRDIHASTEARIALMIRRHGARPHVHPLQRLYAVFDARTFKLAKDPFAPTDVSELLHGVPVAEIEEAADLADPCLDIALDFGSRPLSGSELSVARFGVWSYAYGDDRLDRGGPASFWEVMTRTRVTPSVLHMRSANGETHVLYQSWSATDPISVRRNLANCYWKSSAFVMRAVRDLYELGPAALRRDSGGHREPPRPASGPPIVAALARLGGELIRDHAHSAITRKQWVLAYGRDERRSGAEPTRAFANFEMIVPPRDRFWADPFVVRHGDGWVVLFEEKIFSQRTGHISALAIDRDGNVRDAVTVLECDYHLSYPFTFSWNDTWWMIPESANNNTVDLWRAIDFPRRWTRERTLFDNVHAVDTTLIEHDGTWWMFCNIGEPGASKDDELHLFHARSPLGPWVPHRRNPVKSNIRGSRPAGRPFRSNGAWYRPAQDSADGYGARIILHRIDVLDTHAFEETEVSRIEPNWRPGLVGLHTINAADGLTVIDVRLWRSRLPMFDRYERRAQRQ